MDLPYTCDRPGCTCPGTHHGAPPWRRRGCCTENTNRRESITKQNASLCGTQLIHVGWNHAEKRARHAARLTRRGTSFLGAREKRP